MDLEQFTVNWNYPTNIRMGIGRINELPAICQEMAMQKPLLITDPFLAKMPMLTDAVTNCRAHGLSCDIFSDITSNPTAENVSDGVNYYLQGEYDGVIAFGGGSALDAAKAVALMVGQHRPLWDFEDIANNWTRVNSATMAPLIAIPTTSGTGSEVGRASVITDTEKQLKRHIFHPKMLPAMVILDPQLTVALPAKLTAATGMDAMSHALEAFCATTYHPMAEGIAMEAMRLIKHYLPAATKTANDLQARSHLMVASTMGATAFQRGLGAMHALAHSLGALYHSHHGLLNAILMPYVVQANRPVIESDIARLANYLELAEPTFDGFLEWLVSFRRELKIPHTLSDIDINVDEADKIGTMSSIDPCAASNPVTFSADQYAAIFVAAVKGEL